MDGVDVVGAALGTVGAALGTVGAWVLGSSDGEYVPPALVGFRVTGSVVGLPLEGKDVTGANVDGAPVEEGIELGETVEGA